MYNSDIEEENYIELVKTLKTILQFNELVSKPLRTLFPYFLFRLDIQEIIIQSGHYCPYESQDLFFGAVFFNVEVAKYNKSLHF